MDENHQLLLPFIFKKIYPFDPSTGLFQYDFQNRSGYVDLNGKLLLGGAYERVVRVTTNTYMVRLNNKWGMVNAENQILIPLKYERQNLENGLVKVSLKFRSKPTYFDYMGKKVR